jgi:murein DD-endopeptidase MepM/ murein hydrolase activator NlpD
MSAHVDSVRRRPLVVAGLALLAVTVDALVAAPVHAGPCWFPPVVGVVADPFREPPCRWCAGNRGIDYRVDDDVVVRAAESGRVVFVGVVVDVRYVVIQLAGGWRHTYGQLTSTPLELGDVVLANGVIGRASGTVFFGLRIGDDYADPAPFVGTLRSRARLIPSDGTPARPAPPVRPRCP